MSRLVEVDGPIHQLLCGFAAAWRKSEQLRMQISWSYSETHRLDALDVFRFTFGLNFSVSAFQHFSVPQMSDDICEGFLHSSEVPHAAEQEHGGDENAKE